MMSTEFVTIDFRDAFPVFPLQDSVLFPQAVLPLHVFEARYRRMVNDALDSRGLIAVGLFDSHVAPADYASGDFDVRPYVGLGQIRDYHRLGDGQFIIILQGLCRARIVRELQRQPYRRFQLAPTEVAVSEEDQLEDYRHRIEGMLARQHREKTDALLSLDANDMALSTRLMIDLAIATVCRDTPQRYQMLSQPDVRRRAEWLIHRMEHQLHLPPGSEYSN